MTKCKSRKCLGIAGWLFGHKFYQDTVGTRHMLDHCQRCGMPPGGWPQ